MDLKAHKSRAPGNESPKQKKREYLRKMVIQKLIGVDGMQWKQGELADAVCNAVFSSLFQECSKVRRCFSLHARLWN